MGNLHKHLTFRDVLFKTFWDALFKEGLNQVKPSNHWYEGKERYEHEGM